MLEQNQSHQQPAPLEFKGLIEQQRSLAEALGERGEAEEGVRHLERAYDLAKTDEERKEVAALLAGYRSKFNLGQLWQFVNEGGEVFYESTSVEAIRERLLDGSIPRAARCRKNRVGEPLPIKDSLGKQEGRIEILFSPISYHLTRGAGATAVITAIISVIAGFYNLGEALRMSFLQTLAFAVVFLVMFGAIAGLGNKGAGCLVMIVCGFILIAITGGKINFAFLGGFLIGFPIGLFLAALVGAIPGALIGAVVGLLRWPMLPKLPSA
jgi:hypothetical protein